MCGIAACIGTSSPDAAGHVRAMLARLRHRGDCSDPVLSVQMSALGAERLRIVDPARGTQPFTSQDGEWHVVLNGEIYNHGALREHLVNRGITCATGCDTEVLANIIAEYGIGGLEMLDGMFAIVAIHREGKRFLAARDPMGVKPLYVGRAGSCVYFASEILPIAERQDIPQVDFLPPGTWLSESGQGPFWQRKLRTKSGRTLRDNARRLRDLLEEAVRKRIPPNLPCAVLFSGGVDSTLIFHLARKFNPDITGFFIGNPCGEDWDAAHAYQKATGARVEVIPFSNEQVLDLIPEVVRTAETYEPNQIRGGCFSYLLARYIHDRGYKIALCGEGADELFCGYPELQHTSAEAVSPWKEIEEARDHFLNNLHRTQLLRVDRCSMRHQLEVRTPFLDRALVEFAEEVPLDQMVVPNSTREFDNKILLRQLYQFYPEIPPIFAERKKVVLTAGAGMGDNSPRSPFFDHSGLQPSSSLLQIDAHPYLKSVEDYYYARLLRETYDIEKILWLKARPRLNAR